jgi:ribulose 1,5-bisphosphate synthetase/thiazole synthase
MRCTILSYIATSAVLTTVNLAWAANPVCIVGAGPAGLTVANRLETKGYKTVIFEKDREVGGKCQSYYDEEYVYRYFHNR